LRDRRITAGAIAEELPKGREDAAETERSTAKGKKKRHPLRLTH